MKYFRVDCVCLWVCARAYVRVCVCVCDEITRRMHDFQFVLGGRVFLAFCVDARKLKCRQAEIQSLIWWLCSFFRRFSVFFFFKSPFIFVLRLFWIKESARFIVCFNCLADEQDERNQQMWQPASKFQVLAPKAKLVQFVQNQANVCTYTDVCPNVPDKSSRQTKKEDKITKKNKKHWRCRAREATNSI